LPKKQKTLLIIKPDAVKRNLIGRILSRVEEVGFKVLKLKYLRLTKKEARKFYYVHEGKPFLPELVNYMSSGPCVPVLLEKANAISDLRELIGATDPQKAKPGTIRADFAISMTQNSVHASDSVKSAKFEVKFFFRKSR
jgi:nucleoside-diphosphate kinase